MKNVSEENNLEGKSQTVERNWAYDSKSLHHAFSIRLGNETGIKITSWCLVLVISSTQTYG